jgi:hypothetical protein
LKEIFIGSSKEGLEQATQVAAVLSEAQDVKPLLFQLGSREALAEKVVALK